MGSTWLARLREYGAVLLICALALAVSYQLGSPRISGSDETYYAVVARNLAERGSLNTTLHLPSEIIQSGYPHRDTHMPGYMLILALSVALFGPTDAAMMLPSQVAYLASGLVVYWIARKVFSRPVGYASAAAFCLHPLIWFYANTAMAELSLVLIALAFLAVWLDALERPRLRHSLGMALLLAGGSLVRPTFPVFLVPALVALWRWPAATRRRAWLWFAVAGAALALGVVVPLSQQRAQGTYKFYQLLNLADWQATAQGFVDNFVLQASRHAGLPEDFPFDYVGLLQGVTLLVSAVALVRLRGRARALAGYFLYTGATTWLVLSVFYTNTGSRGLRSLLMVIPPGLILLNGLLARVRPRRLGRGLVWSQLLFLAAFGWLGMRGPIDERLEFYQEESREADVIAQNLNAYHPRVVLAYKAWLYAVRYFPVDVIRDFPDSLQIMRQLQERLVIDAVVVDERAQRDQLVEAARLGRILGEFRPVNQEPVKGYYFLVRGDAFEQPVNADLGPELTLLGVDQADALRAGQPLPLTLVWQARTDVQADYVIAVRLLDDQDHEAQYWLGRPVRSQSPTNQWRAGQVVADSWDIRLDPALSPGIYQVEVEVYDAAAADSVGKTRVGALRVQL